MRFIGLVLFVCLVSVVAFSQQDDEGPDTPEKKPAIEEEVVISDKEVFENVVALEDAFQRIDALKAFLGKYPETEFRIRALESLASSRAIAADINLRSDKTEEGIRLFKLAVSESPRLLSDDLFSKVLVNIPTNLFLFGERNAAFDVAEMLEQKSADNQLHLLRLATFYIGIKYATGARRLAEKAIALNPEEKLAFQTMGLSQRLGFDLEGAEESYTRALELDPDSLSIRQNLGELKRALGKSEEAEKLFDEIVKKEAADVPARTGLILSLFDQNRRAEAEALLIKELNENPTNVFVMIGAAHWYAANGEAQLAIDHASQAISIEESAVWAYLVKARGHMLLDKPQAAERALVIASRFGASPTLSYELALVRTAAGFYGEAVEDLKKHFLIENGKIVTDLDGRIGAEADNFSELVGLERKSVLFSAYSAYDPDSDAKLKELLQFEETISGENASDENVAASADAFVSGPDTMKTFRQVYASKRLLDSGKLPEKANQMAKDAVNGVESSVEIDNPSAAVLADQLYERRKSAAKTGNVIIIPEVEKTTLVKIMRGRIEELAGRSLLASEDYTGAEVRFKRAVSVLPKDSSWWRSSMWYLGKVYEKTGDDSKALATYAASYVAGETSDAHRLEIEGVYARVNGSLAGFDEMLSNKTESDVDPASLFIKTTSETEDSSAAPASTPEKGPDKSNLQEDVDLSLAETVANSRSETSESVQAETDPNRKLPEDLNLPVLEKMPEKTVVEIEAANSDAKTDAPDKNPDEAKTGPPTVIVTDSIGQTAKYESPVTANLRVIKTDGPIDEPKTDVTPKETPDAVNTDLPSEKITDPSDQPKTDVTPKETTDAVSTDLPAEKAKDPSDQPKSDVTPKETTDAVSTDLPSEKAKDPSDQPKTDVTPKETSDAVNTDPPAEKITDPSGQPKADVTPKETTDAVSTDLPAEKAKDPSDQPNTDVTPEETPDAVNTDLPPEKITDPGDQPKSDVTPKETTDAVNTDPPPEKITDPGDQPKSDVTPEETPDAVNTDLPPEKITDPGDQPKTDVTPKETPDAVKTDLPPEKITDPGDQPKSDVTPKERTDAVNTDPPPEKITDPGDQPKSDVTPEETLDAVRNADSTDVPLNRTLPPAEETADAPEKLSDDQKQAQNDAVGAELIDLGATRPRVVAADKIRTPPKPVVDPNACEIVSSQESISLIANGGSLGIVVGLKNYEEAYVLRAVTLAPEDISIEYEPEIGSIDGLAFFVIKSISGRTGAFKIHFETPCGIKAVIVDVH